MKAVPIDPAVFAGLDNYDAGALFRLWTHYWATGRPLPSDPRELRRLAQVSAYRWPKFFAKICELAVRIDGPLALVPFLEKALEKQRHIARVRAEAGARGGRAGGRSNEAIAPVHRVPYQESLNLETQSPMEDSIVESWGESRSPHPKMDPANWKAAHQSRVLRHIATRWPGRSVGSAMREVVEGTARGREVFQAVSRMLAAEAERPPDRSERAAAGSFRQGLGGLT